MEQCAGICGEEREEVILIPYYYYKIPYYYFILLENPDAIFELTAFGFDEKKMATNLYSQANVCFD
jgi:hypothetical protein